MKIGNNDINSVKLGSTTVNKVYIGSTKVWPNIVPEFTFTINTALGDGLAEFEFNPGHSGVINYTIFWGDSAATNVTTNTATNHTYSTGGTYQIKIAIVNGINNYDIGASSDNLKLISIDNWGTYTTGFGGNEGFKNCTNLLTVPTTPPTIALNHRALFMNCSSLNSDFNNYSFTGTMEEVFRNCTSLNGTFTNVDATNVNNFQRAFAGCSAFTGSNDLSSITFESATTLWRCFRNCTNLDFGGLSSPTNATSLDLTFQNTSLSDTNYRAMLNAFTGWDGTTATKTLQNNVPAHFGNAQYENCGESEDIRNYLINTKGWTITDGGGTGTCPFTIKINTALGDGLSEFKFTPVVSGTGDFDVDWGDGNVDTNIVLQTDSRLDHSYSSAGIYEIKITSRLGLVHYNLTASPDRLKWIDVVKWGTNSTLTNYSNLFYNADSLTSISATDVPDLSNVTNFGGMLRSSAINYDFSSWDFTNGTTFTFFALSATAINSSIGGNNFSNMTQANSFYQGVTTNTSSLANLTLGGNVSYFFYNTSNFSFNTLTNVDFSNVTNATGMFQNSGLTDTDYRNFLTDLTGWNGTTATKTLQSNVPIHFGTAKYENGGTSEDIRNYLTGTKGWTITDGGGI